MSSRFQRSSAQVNNMAKLREMHQRLIYQFYEADCTETAEEGGQEQCPPPPRPCNGTWQRRDNGSRLEWRKLDGTVISDGSEQRSLKPAKLSATVFWRHQTAEYWIVDRNCTDDSIESDNWHTINFIDLTSGKRDIHPPLYELSSEGEEEQHPATLTDSTNFFRILPGRYFKQEAGPACDLVMEIPLLLGMLAMSPVDAANVPAQIKQHFADTFPTYTPVPNDSPRSRDAVGDKAVVINIAILCQDFEGCTEQEAKLQAWWDNHLEQWRTGGYGPMLSASSPAPAAESSSQASVSEASQGSRQYGTRRYGGT